MFWYHTLFTWHILTTFCPEISPQGRQSQRPNSPSSARHLNSGPRPVQEGRRRLPVQHQEDPPEACACACTGASDIKCLEYHIPVPNECVAYDRRGVHSPGAGKALWLVWPGRHCPGHSRDVSKKLCSDVSSTAPAFSGFILHYLQAAVIWRWRQRWHQ